MLLKDKKVAIIGGGPGGLTLARFLQLQGVDVKVYERDANSNVRVQGATLDLHFESGLKAVKQSGLMEAFKQSYRPGADKGRVVDKHGKVLFDEHMGIPAEDDFDSEFARPEIDRQQLRDMLLASLLPGTVQWDSHFIAMSEIDGQWKLEFNNGTVATADLVIGADGANSKIRPYVTTIKPYYSGVTIIQGNIPDSAIAAPEIHELVHGGKVYVHSDGKFLHISSKGNGSTDFYVGYKISENWIKDSALALTDRAQLLEWYDAEFAGWNPLWKEMFETTGLPLLIRPQYCMPEEEKWKTLTNVTLLGDAAHIMPASGEGVNLAMLDALELSEYLTGKEFNTLQDALIAYETKMMKRAVEEAKVAMDGTVWMYDENAAEKLMELFSQDHPSE